MPRKPRCAPGGLVYHVMNRTRGKIKLLRDSADYEAFERVLAQALQREPTMRLCAYCLMPSHFHLVLWPAKDGQLSRFMQWLTMTQTQRWHARRPTIGRGHLYQSRFRSFPIQKDGHFLSVCRYVEGNSRRAKLARRAENWRWSSLAVRARRSGREHPLKELLADGPVAMPRNWREHVNAPQSEKELAALRCSRERGRPYGDADWATQTAQRLGIESSLRAIGRPRKTADKGPNGL